MKFFEYLGHYTCNLIDLIEKDIPNLVDKAKETAEEVKQAFTKGYKKRNGKDEHEENAI